MAAFSNPLTAAGPTSTSRPSGAARYTPLGVDMDTPYNIYAGLQDHESWKGPSNGWAGSIGIDDWVTVGTGDGMYNQVDPTDSRWVYNTQEFGSAQPVRPEDS